MARTGTFLNQGQATRSGSLLFKDEEEEVLRKAEEEVQRSDQLHAQATQQEQETVDQYDSHKTLAKADAEQPGGPNQTEGFLDQVLKGAAARTPLTEQLDFDKFYDKNKPSTEILSNLFHATASAMGGQKHISVRDKLRGEFETNRKANISREAIAKQAAATILSMQKARAVETGRMERHDDNLGEKVASREQRNEQANQQFSLDTKEYQLGVDKLNLDRDKFVQMGEKLPDTLLESSRVMLKTSLGELGDDATPEEKMVREKLIISTANELSAQRARENASAKNRYRQPQRARFQLKQFTDGDGRTRTVRYDLDNLSGVDADTGRAVTTRDIKDFTPTALAAMTDAEKAIGQMRTLSELAKNHPKLFSLGNTILTELPGPLKALSEWGGIINPELRKVDSLIRELTVTMVRAATGAQATDREREYIQEQLPSLTNPENVRIVLGIKASMAESTVLRQRFGIDKRELNLEEVFAEAIQLTGDSEGGAYIPSAGQLLAEAAIRANRKDLVTHLISKGAVTAAQVTELLKGRDD